MSRKQQRPFSAAPSSRAMNQYLRRERFLRGRGRLSMFTRILGYLCLLFCLAYCILFFHFYNITPDVTLSILRTHKVWRIKICGKMRIKLWIASHLCLC